MLKAWNAKVQRDRFFPDTMQVVVGKLRMPGLDKQVFQSLVPVLTNVKYRKHNFLGHTHYMYLYSTVDESSDELEIGLTRKEILFLFFPTSQKISCRWRDFVIANFRLQNCTSLIQTSIFDQYLLIILGLV